MSTDIATSQVVVSNPQGLHARPADLFVRLAQTFDSSITIIKDDRRADGKGILDLLTLGAQQGTELIIEASGTDAQEAVEALTKLVNEGFSEDQG